MYKTVIKAA